MKKTISLIIATIFGLSVILSISCVGKNIALDKDEPTLSYRDSQIDNIRESVFRYQIEDIGYTYVNDENVKSDIIYFISIGYGQLNPYEDIDPSDSFMERFKNNIPLVKKVHPYMAGAMISEDNETGKKKVIECVDTEINKRGLILRVNDIEWVSDSWVWVKGEYFKGRLAATLKYYRVVLKDNKWVVMQVYGR
jgi:hypothetical protein